MPCRGFRMPWRAPWKLQTTLNVVRLVSVRRCRAFAGLKSGREMRFLPAKVDIPPPMWSRVGFGVQIGTA
jgi:hypothetical protein